MNKANYATMNLNHTTPKPKVMNQQAHEIDGEVQSEGKGDVCDDLICLRHRSKQA